MSLRTGRPGAGAAAAAPAADGRPALLTGLLAAGLALAGALLFQLPLRDVRVGQVNGLGLISVLPVQCLIGAALLVTAFVLMLSLPRASPALLAVTITVIVVCLDGVTARAEALPRFATSYQIAGFVEYISRTGHTAPALDAYFSWPGFFALTAMLAGAAGAHDLTSVLRWWPTAIDLLCLVPLFVITRSLRCSWRARWCAALLFSLGNWVGQDYFSPQSASLLLYLVLLAVLLTWFGREQPAAQLAATGQPAAQQPARRGPALLTGERSPQATAPGQRIVLILLLIGVFTATTVSHQLTPFLMIAACAGLVLARRCTLAGLPVLLGVILLGWVSFGAVAYWSGHLGEMFGQVGQLTANVSASVGGRLTGTPQHRIVLDARVGGAVLVLVLAGLGLLRRRRRGISDRAAAVLLCVPFVSVAFQSYGGEIALRTYLFALPAASVLAAYLFFPGRRDGPVSWRPLVAAGAVSVGLTGLFLLARYGNEAFERTPAGELTAMNYLYARDSAGIRLIWLSPPPIADATPQMPWQYRDFEKVSYVTSVAPRDPASVGGLVRQLRSAGPGSYLVTTTTQEQYLEQVAGYPADWGARLRSRLAAAPGVRTAFTDRDAVVFTMRWPPGQPRQPLPVTSAASPALASAWTPAGLAALWLLLVMLTAREIISTGVPRARRLVTPLTIASIPLLAVLLIAVAERFVLLS